jgi:phospholipase C
VRYVVDLTPAFDFRTPDAQMPPLPDTSNYKTIADNQCATQPAPTVPAVPGVIDPQEPGTRFARALPYELYVQSSVDGGNKQLTLHFANTGSQGAHFYVYSSNRTDGPWRYTVEAGKTLRDSFDINRTAGIYAFTVYGPNGFVREFAGTLTPPGSGSVSNPPADPELAAQYDVANGNVSVKFTNRGRGIAHLSVVDNAYGAQPRPVLVPSLGSVEESWILAASHHWYDLRVTSNNDPTFLRRLAGHVENGRPSISDPAAVAPVTVLA